MESLSEKDPRILEMLTRLQASLETGAFDIVDHWKSEPTAVGIASPQNNQVLVYIAFSEDAFDVELELPPSPNNDFPYEVAGSHRGLSFDQLAEIVVRHFSIGLKSDRARAGEGDWEKEHGTERYGL